VPILFAGLIDPVGGGLVATLARPGGNTTGFMSIEYGMVGKLPELLKQIVPGVTRAAVLRDPTAPGGSAQLGAIQAVAPFLGMEVSPIDVRDANEIERWNNAAGSGWFLPSIRRVARAYRAPRNQLSTCR
jgi:putative ABC transport system substrate-binding protein